MERRAAGSWPSGRFSTMARQLLLPSGGPAERGAPSRGGGPAERSPSDAAPPRDRDPRHRGGGGVVTRVRSDKGCTERAPSHGASPSRAPSERGSARSKGPGARASWKRDPISSRRGASQGDPDPLSRAETPSPSRRTPPAATGRSLQGPKSPRGKGSQGPRARWGRRSPLRRPKGPGSPSRRSAAEGTPEGARGPAIRSPDGDGDPWGSLRGPWGSLWDPPSLHSVDSLTGGCGDGLAEGDPGPPCRERLPSLGSCQGGGEGMTSPAHDCTPDWTPDWVGHSAVRLSV
ncbi:unnamed protein product [Lampetra fluviatilis]